jgi:hypothetical protein
MHRAHTTLDLLIIRHGPALSVLVDDLDVMGIALIPAKAYPPLPIDADAELPRTIAGECLKAIARKATQILQATGPPKDLESLLRLVAKAIEPSHPSAFVERLCIAVAKALDHSPA